MGDRSEGEICASARCFFFFKTGESVKEKPTCTMYRPTTFTKRLLLLAVELVLLAVVALHTKPVNQLRRDRYRPVRGGLI